MDKVKIEIAGRTISSSHPPYVIAELSANHSGSYERALKIIDEAANAGADAIKLQTYKPDTITLDSDSEEFKIEGGLWDGRTLYDLYEEAHTPWDWHKPLFEHARKIDITIFNLKGNWIKEIIPPRYLIPFKIRNFYSYVLTD